MSKNNFNRVKMQLAKNPKLTADIIMRNLDISKAYAYNLLSTARKALGMHKLPDGSWKLKERMEGTRPTTRDEKISNPSVYETIAVMSSDKPITQESNSPRIVEAHYPTEDSVNHPSHYKTGGIETIDFIEAKGLNYHLGNVVKYITRADHKGERLENLLKARWYLNREIAKSTKE